MSDTTKEVEELVDPVETGLETDKEKIEPILKEAPKKTVDFKTFQAKDPSKVGLGMIYSEDGKEKNAITSEFSKESLIGLADYIYKINGIDSKSV